MQKLRVFIASPEDVELERSLVIKIINLLQVEFAGRVDIEQIIWELEPLLATSSFQDQIEKPSSCQIAIFIFRNRFGTPLPSRYHRPDGSLYMSGTEYEFEEARESFLKTGSPQILVYRNRKGKYIDVNDDELDNIVKQKRALDEFEKKWFVDEADNTFKGAFYQFKTSDEFERLVESHLLKLITQLAPGHVTEGESSYRMWLRGNPFVGLNSFGYEHAAVFFGRTRAISDCVQLLESAERAGCPFLLVLGMSGGGKSSLVHAGILPMLSQKDVIEDVSVSKWVSMRPSDMDGQLFERLISALVDEKILPSLDAYESEDLISMAAEEPEKFSQLIADAVNNDSQKPPGYERLVLVVDQFEELYTSSNIAEDDRYRFTSLLEHLVRDARIWCIVTIRSDYYPTLTADPCLAALKTDGAQYDLKVPTPAEIFMMIRAPAIAAGLHYEKHPDTGEALEETIRQAAEAHPEILPLLEYTLSELYAQKSSDGFLTYNAYEKLGGVEGALALTAERCFGKMSPREQETLPYVFNTLIEFTGEGNLGRRWVSLDTIENEQTKAFITAFVGARLFVIELDSAQNQIVTVTHESLFRYWPRLQDWVENNREQIRVRSRLDAATRLWVEQEKSADMLLGEGKPADEAGLLTMSGLTVLQQTQQFINASLARAKRNKIIRISGIVLVFLFAIIAGVGAYQANLSSADAERRLSQNEYLIAFMLDDLIEELRPIGKLDLMRIVGEKAIELFKTISDEDLTDFASLKHAQALHQVGEVYFNAGEFREAAEAFTESLRQIETLYSVEPENTDRLFELGQAHYWVGFSNWYHENLDTAEQHLGRYLNISETLVELDPNNVRWQKELGYAINNLGSLENSRSNYVKALNYFESSNQLFLELSKKFPDDDELKQQISREYSWIASAYLNLGRLQNSKEYLFKQESLLKDLIARNVNADLHYELFFNQIITGELLIDFGNLDQAVSRLESGLEMVKPLLEKNPENKLWRYGEALCFYDISIAHYYKNDLQKAKVTALEGQYRSRSLLQSSNGNIRWRILDTNLQLLSARIVHAISGRKDFELVQTLIETAVDLHRLQSGNIKAQLLLANAYLVAAEIYQGDIRRENAGLALEILSTNNREYSNPEALVSMVRAYRFTGDDLDVLQNRVAKLLDQGGKHPVLHGFL